MQIEMRISSNNTKIWHEKSNAYYFHREDGPALICSDGREFWWYYDVKYHSPEEMPLNLYLAYVKWEYKKNGS